MKEEKKEKSKKKVICIAAVTTLVVAGAGYLAYRKIPKIKSLVDGILPSKNTNNKIERKPFKKYETYNKKR